MLLFCFGISISHPSTDVYDIQIYNAEFLSAHTVRIPLKNYGQLLIIEGNLLGKKGNFIVDTGSETLILNSNYYTANPRSKKNNPTYGVLSSIDNPLQRRLNEFNLKGLVMRNKSSDVIDLSHIENSKKMKVLGIIGFNILKDYEIFIDLYLNQITLTKTDKEGNLMDDKVYLETIDREIPFQLKKHSIIINPTIQDKTYKFVLDTGSELNQINKRIVKKSPQSFKPQRRLKLSGASGRKIEVMVGELNGLSLDSLKLKGMQTILTNLNYAYEAFGTRIDGVLGYEFFLDHRTIINYKKEMLYVVKHPEN